MSETFSLMLFAHDGEVVRRAVAAGVDAILVDWEFDGKRERQVDAGTEINRHTAEDLLRVRLATRARVVCRINRAGPTTEREVEAALAAGADELLLPMVETVQEVEAVLRRVAGRCGVGILVETVRAVALARELGRLPLTRAYVGLNDLSIQRRTPSIFSALADGTVESVRPWFDVPFGFGGLTLPDLGSPIPCRLLIGEMARLRCGFSFLRRSFYADMRGRDHAVEIPRLRAALVAAWNRASDDVERDRAELADRLAREIARVR